MAIERHLTRKLGEAGRRVHTARSRNDQVAVDLRLYARESLSGCVDECVALANALARLASRHRSVPMAGRTHMQPAMPSTVGLWAASHAESLLDDLTLLNAAYTLNDQCPLGAAAGYGVPIPIDRPLTAKLLGFNGIMNNVLYATSARGKCESAILGALGQIMLTLSRLSQDLILYGMPEFGYFTLPAELGTGSSLMPQKNNPDVLELVRARAAQVLAAGHTAAEIMRGLPAGYNRDAQESKGLLMDGVGITRSSLRILTPIIDALQVNRKALRDGFNAGVFATDRVLELVAEGMPFRDAYRHVKKHLSELEDRDPQDAALRKKHSGAPGNLDLPGLRRKLQQHGRQNRSRRNAYHRALSKLLGVSYPDLKSKSTRR
jgi:argininosuccinate lyase